MGLKEYKARRKFGQTREPAGSARKKAPENFFVIQKHDATRLHYDFRLAMDGVLKSWAVPKGLPFRRGDRRLAVQVEDHPMDYADFEGIIPKGNYGAGTVMVWDRGGYAVSGDEPGRAMERGKLHLTLRGKKLKGEWTLVRMRRRDDDDKPQWLLLKSGGDMEPLSARADDRSVVSKRSLAQIAGAADREWQSDRAAARSVKRAEPVLRKSRRAEAAPSRPEVNLGRLPRARPAFVEPMKALLRKTLPKGPEWIFELKFDGVRALAVKQNRKVELVSRNGKDFARRFPEVVESIRALPVKEAVVDGEIVALDSDGKSSFQMLQSHQTPGRQKPPIFFYVFDLIQLDGKDLRALPLLKRKAVAESLVAQAGDPLRFSSAIQGDSDRLVREMKARGLEGLIAKKKESPYEPGRRSGAWVKFKWTTEQEFVIGGYTQPKGARTHFGAILTGYYERGKLLFASKVGTGFDEKLLKSLCDRFQSLRRAECPFANLPEKAGAHGRGLTASEMRRCTWLEPKLVCQVRFAEWTRDNHLRQPAFLGLREDKNPREVVREKAA
jgi:bifunctional non-homologous end joining protein LigD